MSNRFEETPTINPESNEKTVAASRVRMNELVMPNDTNPLGNLMGGRLMQWMDICSVISARRHCNQNVVAVAADSIEFKNPIELGEVVVIEVTRTFKSSMEVAMEVWVENMRDGDRRLCTTSFYTCVALDANGETIEVPKITPETDFEKKRYEQAEQRREMRLKVSEQNIDAHQEEKTK